MNVPQIGKKAGEPRFFVWIDDGGFNCRRISPTYSKIAYCQAFLDGWKAHKAEELRGRRARDAQEERIHNEAMEDAFGPHGQG